MSTANKTKKSLQFLTTKTITPEIRRALYCGQLVLLKNLKSANELVHYFSSNFTSTATLQSAWEKVEKKKVTNELTSTASVKVRETEKEDTTKKRRRSFTIKDRVQCCEWFESSPKVHLMYHKLFTEAGLIPHETFWDRLRLRIQSSGDPVDNYTNTATFGAGRFSSTLPVHRDTWGSHIQQQINWWMPLKPLNEECTLIIYPSYFNQKVANNSNSWDLKKLREARRRNEDYPQLPTLLNREMISDSYNNEFADSIVSLEELEKDAVPIMIHPGDVLVFSGAHLHGSSIGGTKGNALRFSTEVRTYNAQDYNMNIGAPNIDGPNILKPKFKWFQPLSDE
jgi:hypothetical protein